MSSDILRVPIAPPGPGHPWSIFMYSCPSALHRYLPNTSVMARLHSRYYDKNKKSVKSSSQVIQDATISNVLITFASADSSCNAVSKEG